MRCHLIPLITNTIIAIMFLPLIFKKIPPHSSYGIKTKSTLADRNFWYIANAYAGKSVLLASVSSSLLLFLTPFCPIGYYKQLVLIFYFFPYVFALFFIFRFFRIHA
ncbi:MAG: SdpI family protein [Acidobacteria bacterium]|nr:SdpI family protein [Acidobacteriota bacterium]